ncbi:acyl-CoA carboxylase epsilon subunit [Streptomyces catenulae]|uniref:Acyl-CoA carboxylase epsilon subunit n=1 Tax=Streptomyces catenulae TaxID=66875 RepID=A0ABV2YZV5_9ACTN|nr:acyl-CoA carboxylase epsilon subunit [Streptomyces catenulae]
MATEAAPFLRVTGGNATPEELAALVVAVLARQRPAARPGEIHRHRPNWRRLERALGHRGPRSWRGETRSTARHTG